jgi:hypothetical protein
VVAGAARLRRLGRNVQSIRDNIDRFGFSMSDSNTDDIITEQKGVFRVSL